MGEDTSGMAESTASLREEIYALSGVDIMKNANEFKSTYAIMDELADKWEGLSDIAQASITELLAGKHQGNVMSSLMANFDIARDALETSQNSAGSAMAEHAKWSDSLEARLNKLKATWQSLSQSFLSSGFLKGGISAVTGFVDVIDNLVDKFGALPTLISAVAGGLSLFKNQGIFKFDKNTNSIKSFNIELSNMAKTYSSLKSSIGDYNFLASQQKSLIKQQSLLASLSKKNSLGKQGVKMLNQQELIEQQDKIEKQQKKLANTQENFNKSVAQSNTSLANYFSGLNGGKASIAGYIASLVKAKVATIALQAATVAMNAALTMGISALISWGVSAISKWINEANDLAEKVDEITSKYKDQHSELMKLKGDYDTTKEDSMISKYGELSKGVSAFGENLSLTADEYAEYQNIVNSIADQIPSLVSGYDSQGNAILSCAGNVEELTKAYENLIRTQNNEILINSAGDINKDFKNAVKDAEYNTEGWFKGADWTQEIGLGAKKLSTKSAQIYKDIVNAKDAVAEFNKAITADEYGSEEYLDGIDIDAMSELLEKAGFEKNGKGLNKEQSISHVRRALEENREAVNGILTNYFSGLEADAQAKKTQAQAALSNALDLSDSMYYGMSDTMKNIARQTVGSFDFGFFADLEDKGVSVEEYVNNMLNSLNSLSKMDKTSIEAAFELRTKFNGGDISYGEYVDSIKEIGNLINDSTLTTETKDAIKNALNIDGVIEQYDALSKRLQNDFKWDKSKAENFLNSLSAEEFAIAMEIIPELDAGTTASEIQDMIDKEMAMRGLTVKLNLEVEKANIEAVTTALSEMVSGAGMSSESISAVEGMFSGLRGYDPSKLFERTANGIRLNREEFNKLNSEYSKTNLAELNKKMSSLGDIYNQTRKELYNLAYGTDEYNAKLAELDNIENQINSTEKLISQYKGLTSAYQQWQIAESSGNERDMYESVISGIETVKDELSRGWVDDGTREFMQLLKGETATIIDGKGQAKEIDIATASAKELKQVWDGLDDIIEHTAEGGHKGYSLRDFFTTDKDGNATSKGVYNFLDAIGHMEEEVFGGVDELVQRDDKTGNIIGFNFDLVGGDEVIAEALGISEELVQIMVRAAGDAGFVVSFDGTYQQLDVLREKAQLAAESMNKILEGNDKKTIEIDMNAKTVKEIQPQIDSIMETFGAKDGSGKLTGAIDMTIEGSEDALTVVSTLQSMKDRLERPAYMNIQVNQVEDDLKEPLKNLQDYRTKIEQLNQAKLHGADTTELEASIKESKDKVVADLLEIQENNPELSGQLKIEGLSKEEIESKVEKGDITIPATVDVQLEMDEKLGILVDKALLDAGLISPEEFTKRVELYLDTEIDDKDAKEETDNAVNEIANDTENKPKPKPISIEQDFDLKLGNVTSDITQDDVATGKDGLLAGMGAEPITVNQDVNVETGEVKTEGFWSKLKNWLFGGSGSNDGGVATGADGHKKAIGVVDTNVDANVNVNNVTTDGAEKVDEAVQSDAGGTTTVEKDVQLDLSVDEYKSILEDLKSIESSEITITTTVVGKEDISSLRDLVQELEDEEIAITTKVVGKDDINNLKESVQALEDEEVAITIDIDGENGIEDLKSSIEAIESSDITISANIEGNLADGQTVDNIVQYVEKINELEDVTGGSITIKADIKGGITDENIISNLAQFTDKAKELKGVGTVNVIINATIGEDINNESISKLKRFASAIKGLPTSNVDINVKANVDTGSIESAISILQRVANSGLLQDYNASVTVTYNKDSSEPDNYIPEDKDAFVRYHKESSEVDGYDPPNLHRYVYYHIVTLGGAGAGGSGDIHAAQAADQGWYWANGTAHANGTAFAGGTAESGKAFKSGNWATKESGVALMGELGRELIVRNGKFFTVGDEGAGFFPYQRGDIIFNHKQTEELLNNGFVTSNGGRGTLHGALANGTAFSSGTIDGWDIWNEKFHGSGKNSPSGGGGDGGDDGDDEEKDKTEENKNEVFDWIEKLLERFDRAIDMLDKAANNIYKSFDKRNDSLSDEITKVTEQISNQKKAYERYIAEAETVGDDIGFDIGDDFREKIRKGDFSVDVLNDEQLIEYIGYFEEWYEKALECQEAIQDLEETLSSLYALRVENVATQYEGILGVIEHEKNILEEYINQSETQAWLVSSKYYDALASNERETIAELQNQKAEMLIAFEEAMASGTIDEGSESYYEMVASIDEVTLAIKESETQLLEYEQTLQQLSWEIFDLLQDKISSVTDETDFLIELLSNKKLYDDNSQLTNEGSATMGLHGVAYNTYMHQADLAAEEIAKLKKELEEDPFDTELEERYREMIALQQEYILSAESQKNAIRDLVEEGIQLELDALDERIEKYKEALDSERDLYDYQKKVKEQSEEIASLEKQRLAYQDDDSEEAKAKLQEIEVSLKEAEEELAETEMDRLIENSERLLDNLLIEYEETLNTRMDNIDYLVEQMIDEINADSSIISDTIRETADKVGYTLTDSMSAIWDKDSLDTKNVITTYGDKFVNAQTTTNNALNAINTNLQNMINQLNKKATANTKSASTSSVAKSSNKKTNTTKTTTKKSNGGDGKPKIGDRVKYVSGQYYYDSQGKKPLGSHNLGKYVYITNINEKDWATHGYHISTGKKLGSGDLGWLKLNQISGYATGKKNFLDNEIAWTQEDGKEFIVRPSDGAILTPVAKGDSILTSAASKNIWDFANSPAEFIKDNLNFGSTSAPNNSNSQNNYTQYLDKVVFNLPNVKNYEQFLTAMQKDKNFERLIQSMTIDQISGKSSLGKGKSIR